jgi:hypothetical protein
MRRQHVNGACTTFFMTRASSRPVTCESWPASLKNTKQRLKPDCRRDFSVWLRSYPVTCEWWLPHLRFEQPCERWSVSTNRPTCTPLTCRASDFYQDFTLLTKTLLSALPALCAALRGGLQPGTSECPRVLLIGRYGIWCRRSYRPY